jgi:NAD(P)H-hydrate repair Nnr-like enzyme with NAD(P)H-hydrate dehydratase domain
MHSYAKVKQMVRSLKIDEIVPQMSNSRRKGQNGRLGVIGGSIEYTGAPYHSSIAQLLGVCVC